jgi:heme/copper-type cytochrome/quinol oxidase subunit 2
MGNSGEKRKGRRHLLKVGTRPNRDQMHREEQREIGHNSLIGIVVIVVIVVIVAAILLFR